MYEQLNFNGMIRNLGTNTVPILDVFTSSIVLIQKINESLDE